MEIRFNHNFYVMNMDEDFNFDSLESNVNKKLKLDLNKNILSDIEFDLIYNNVENILVYKRKQTFKKENYTLYKIHIPVPRKSEVDWGIEDSNFITSTSNLKFANFNIIEKSNIKNYANLEDFLVDCISLGVKNILN